MSRDNEILLDLANACDSISSFIVGMSKDEFLDDTKTQSSVLYQIIIIGESVNRLSESFKGIHSEIPYAQIKGMRNRVTHEYKDVDLDIVWDAINTDIPNLLNIISSLLR